MSCLSFKPQTNGHVFHCFTCHVTFCAFCVWPGCHCYSVHMREVRKAQIATFLQPCLNSIFWFKENFHYQHWHSVCRTSSAFGHYHLFMKQVIQCMCKWAHRYIQDFSPDWWSQAGRDSEGQKDWWCGSETSQGPAASLDSPILQFSPAGFPSGHGQERVHI